MLAPAVLGRGTRGHGFLTLWCTGRAGDVVVVRRVVGSEECVPPGTKALALVLRWRELLTDVFQVVSRYGRVHLLFAPTEGWLEGRDMVVCIDSCLMFIVIWRRLTEAEGHPRTSLSLNRRMVNWTLQRLPCFRCLSNLAAFLNS